MYDELKEKPKECPFCFFAFVTIEEQRVSIDGKERTLYYVECPSCGNRDIAMYDTKEEAVKAWNEMQVFDKQPDLEPCPFCGQKQIKSNKRDEGVYLTSGYNFYGKNRYMVRCGNCGACTAQFFDDADAVLAWNVRI